MAGGVSIGGDDARKALFYGGKRVSLSGGQT